MKKIRICNALAYIILFCLVLTISPFVLPKVFGFEPYGILSDSMEPNYPVGSLVYVKKGNAQDAEIGDVITFKLGVASNQVATHRIVEINEKQEAFITKGDHNEEIDAAEVSFTRYIGKVVLCIPQMGNFYLWLVSAFGMAIGSFSLGAVVLLWYLVSYWKKQVNTKNKTYMK